TNTLIPGSYHRNCEAVPLRCYCSRDFCIQVSLNSDTHDVRFCDAHSTMMNERNSAIETGFTPGITSVPTLIWLSGAEAASFPWFLGVLLTVLAVKVVWQYYVSGADVLRLLDLFKPMVNDSIRIGLLNDASSLRRLSLLSYNQLARYDSPSCYKLCAISRAAGILAARRKSIRRGFPTKTPYAVRAMLISCYGFKVENGELKIPVSRGRRFSIPLTKHTLEVISQRGVEVRSFTLTQ